jgi:hypothetical protein
MAAQRFQLAMMKKLHRPIPIHNICRDFVICFVCCLLHVLTLLFPLCTHFVLLIFCVTFLSEASSFSFFFLFFIFLIWVKLLVQCSSIQDRKTVFYFNELCWGDGSSLRSQTFHHDYLHSCLPALFIAVPRLINLTFIGGKHMPISHYFLLLLCLFTMEIHKWDNLDLVCSCFNRVLVNFFFFVATWHNFF